MSKRSQTSIPETFPNLWKVSGWHDENDHAERVCFVVRYGVDAEGHECVVVQFLEMRDLFEPMEAELSPHMLFPYRGDAKPQRAR